MTFKELFTTLEQRKKGLAYKMWREANLIGLSVSDLFSKRGKRNYPESPKKACPELYPESPSIKKPGFLNGQKMKLKGDMKIYE